MLNINPCICSDESTVHTYALIRQVDCTYPEKEGFLDFETVRVTDTISKQVSLMNKGKFVVNFRVVHKSQLAKELFSVSELEGEIPPSSNVEVDVIFNKDASLQREIELKAFSDIQIIISEPLTGEREVSIPLPVRVKAVFSKFTILPTKGINFGPHLYNTVSTTKEIEIVNNGIFPFQYCVEKLEQLDQPEKLEKLEKSPDRKAPPHTEGDGARGAARSNGELFFFISV